MTDASIALNRFGLGAAPGETPGPDPRRWLTAQLAQFEPRPTPIAALPGSRQILSEYGAHADRLTVLRRERREAAPAAASAPPMVPPAAPAMADASAMPAADMPDALQLERRAARERANAHYAAQALARAQVAVTSRASLVERLTHFWANHFAVSADKFELLGLSGAMEFEAIRPHVLGRFGDMLQAVERHPAMLYFLDQTQSVGPGSRVGVAAANAKRARGLNENLAREILELHTLGVRSGYAQADVTEFARALTGWTVVNRATGPGGTVPAGFSFSPRFHEPGTRTILGRQWPQQGADQAAAVLDYLATHPATARHIATKLARHFAGDDPPAPLVARLEKAFLQSGGDLPTVYRALIAAPECWVPQPVKFKSPWEWTISVQRGLGLREQNKGTVGLINQLGQPIWRPGSPAGWDDIAPSWAGPDALMRRVEAAERIAQRTRDTLDARARAAALFPGALSPATAQAIARAESPAQGVALMLVAPEFLRR